MNQSDGEQERDYLRFLKRRQRTALLVERGVVVLLLVALVLFISSLPSSRPLTEQAWWLALMCL